LDKYDVKRNYVRVSNNRRELREFYKKKKGPGSKKIASGGLLTIRERGEGQKDNWSEQARRLALVLNLLP